MGGSQCKYAIGIDIGTTSCKLVVVELNPSTPSKYRQLWSKQLPHNACTSASDNSRHEQSIVSIVQCIDSLLLEGSRTVPSSVWSRVSNIGFSCQMHGVCRWNQNLSTVQTNTDRWMHMIQQKSSEATSNSYFDNALIDWEDKRCSDQQLQQWNANVETHRSVNLAGEKLQNGYGMASLAWLNAQPQQPQAGLSMIPTHYDSAGTIGDFIVFLLSGSHVTDQTNAASMGCFDPVQSQWNTHRITNLGIDPSVLPSIRPSGSIAGPLYKEFATRYSLQTSDHVEVHVCVGDHPASVYASQPHEGELLISIGTSAQAAGVIDGTRAAAMLKAKRVDTSTATTAVEIRPYITPFSQSTLLLIASLNGGNVLSAFVKEVHRRRKLKDNIEMDIDSLWSELITKAQQGLEDASKDKGSFSLPALNPCFFGERHLSSASSSSSSSSSSEEMFHTIPARLFEQQPAHVLFAALCKSLLENLRTMLALDSTCTQVHFQRLRLAGSSFTRNPLLVRFAAEVFHMQEKQVQVQREDGDVHVDAAQGAALLALDWKTTLEPLWREVAVPSTSSSSSSNSAPSQPLRRNNDPHFIGLAELKKLHLAQHAKFKEYQSQKRWMKFHNSHYDWWSFPLPETSKFQLKYTIYEWEAAELIRDAEFMSAWHDSVTMVTQAWGWDMECKKYIANPDRANGQTWSNWPIRLYKMLYSAMILQQQDVVDSLTAFGRDLIAKKNDFTFGNRDLTPLFLKGTPGVKI